MIGFNPYDLLMIAAAYLVLDINALVQLAIATLMALVGFPALLSLVLTTLEYFGKITQEQADKINFWANAVAFVGIFILAVAGKIEMINQIDVLLSQVAKAALQILILLGVPAGFAITKAFHTQHRNASFVAPRLIANVIATRENKKKK